MRNSIARFMVAAVLIAAAGIFLHVHSAGDVFPSRLTLQSFPSQFGSWEGTDVPQDPEVLRVLGPGDFLLRAYQNESEQQQPAIALFIAYFPSQRAGDNIHSPQNCLPGTGWTPLENHRIMLSYPGHQPFPANRYVIARGDIRQTVLYWYWAHDRGVASEYLAKYHLVADSIKMNRSDGSLIRLSTDMKPGENADAAGQRLLPMAANILPLLNDYIPR